MKKEKRTAGKLLMILMIVFFYLPILYMIVFSFNEGKSLTTFTGFSLRWYRHMLESDGRNRTHHRGKKCCKQGDAECCIQGTQDRKSVV